jgi:hypothetical protein
MQRLLLLGESRKDVTDKKNAGNLPGQVSDQGASEGNALAL